MARYARGRTVYPPLALYNLKDLFQVQEGVRGRMSADPSPPFQKKRKELCLKNLIPFLYNHIIGGTV
jgi:hypothetical protein